MDLSVAAISFVYILLDVLVAWLRTYLGFAIFARLLIAS